MKVLLLSRYTRLGASSRVRFYQYIPYLKEQGIEVTVSPLFGDDYIKNLYSGNKKCFGSIIAAYFRRLGVLLKSRRFDLLWIEKELFPWLPALAEAVLQWFNIPYVVDYDDAVFHRYDLHSNVLVRSFLGRKIDKVMRRAALVLVGNDYLAERAYRAGAKRVEYLPTVIDLNRYNVVDKAGDTSFNIGWIGSPATAKYLNLVHPALAEVCRKRNTRLVLVGSGEIKLENVPIMLRSWSEETEVADIQSFDVGIMPLPDEPWERGKCGYKLIQYMACGVPVVASPVGVNKQIVENGVNGYLCQTTIDWVNALTTLRDIPELRVKMGRAGRIKVGKKYCTQVTAPRLVALLHSIGGVG
ncbi:MAG: glycosyltransferase family 4 protein [Firmicutes bacterium]|nr:glycosyltransferase family 4 protein [Bacillota bacterium]